MQNFSISDDSTCNDVDSVLELKSWNVDQDNLSVVNVNIRSLKKNFSKLTTFLSQVIFKVKIIVVTETWLRSEHDNLLKIKGYNHISMNRVHDSSRRIKSGGGLRIYSCETLNVDLIPKLSGDFSSHESLFVSISTRNSGNIILGAIYRPPNKSIVAFNGFLQQNIFNDNFNHNVKYIITGDINIKYIRDVSSYMILHI